MTDENTKDKQIVANKPIKLSELAPPGVDGRLWVKVLKDQLLASKNGDPTDEELMYFARVAQSSALDPTRKEIYGIYRGGKLTIQTGIDGLRVAAERSGKYAGSDEPDFEYDPDVKIQVQSAGYTKIVPNKAKVTVLKVVDGQVFKTTRTAKWEDYYPGDNQGQMWKKYPETMLAKCAEAQALRAAFPNLGQLYLEEEMQSAGSVVGPSTAMEQAAEQIRSAETLDALFNIMQKLDPQQQLALTPLVNQRADEIKEAARATAN